MGPNVKIEKVSSWTASESTPKVDISFIPPMERRRLTAIEKIVLSVVKPIYPVGENIPVVFASCWGEIGTTLKLMQQFFSEKEMSPAGFAVSVHNAAAGCLSLREKNTAPYTAISAGISTTLRCGFLEALAMRTRVLFVYAEEATPEMYKPHFPDVQCGKGVAVLMDSSMFDGNIPDEKLDDFDEFVKWAQAGL
ncbi:MAG: beta-ketoacyl synthase chain length factor [Kiritimatiellae bacterium]|nr:beta-ketoacyl synthase chain length factor [Kiritimatiellia bacterium]